MSRGSAAVERLKMAEHGYLTPPECAALAKVGLSTVHRVIESGILPTKNGEPYVKDRRKRRLRYVLASAWLGWVEAHRGRINEYQKRRTAPLVPTAPGTYAGVRAEARRKKSRAT